MPRMGVRASEEAGTLDLVGASSVRREQKGGYDDCREEEGTSGFQARFGQSGSGEGCSRCEGARPEAYSAREGRPRGKAGSTRGA